MYKNAAYQEYMDAIPVVLPEKYNNAINICITIWW